VQIRQDLLSWPGFNYQNWQLAAQFAVANSIDLDEALVWADKAIYEPFRSAAQGRADYSTLSTKASVLRALGRQLDSDTTMDRALQSDGADAPQIHQYGMSLLQAGLRRRPWKSSSSTASGILARSSGPTSASHAVTRPSAT
jgi:hypothetical protein